jgi:hypothetical protein
MKNAIGDLQRDFAKKATIVASLELAILDDGHALGSDSANEVSDISARLDADRAVLGGIVAASQQGKSAVVEYLSGLVDGHRPTGGRIEASQEKTAASAYAKFFSTHRADWARIYLSMARPNLAVLIAHAEARLNAPRFTIYR